MHADVNQVAKFGPLEIVYRCVCAICGVVWEQKTVGDEGQYLLEPSRPPFRLIDRQWVCSAHKVEQITMIDGVEGEFKWEQVEMRYKWTPAHSARIPRMGDAPGK